MTPEVTSITENLTCPDCKDVMTLHRDVPTILHFEGREIKVVLDEYRCPRCDLSVIDSDNYEKMRKAIHGDDKK